MSDKTIYFPGLNGLRAICAIAVVVSHITAGLKEFNLNPHIFGTNPDGYPKGLLLGAFAVSIFFVISGFLITFLLLAEKKVQSIDIKKFYLRRALRIWPLYYTYLFLALITAIIFGLHLNTKTLFHYLFFTANIPFIFGTALPFLSHYWSLAVEEQFYLFWPWFIKKVNRYIVPIIAAGITVFISFKIWLQFFHPNIPAQITLNVTRFHCMMIGAAGAILYREKNKLFLKLTDNKIAQALCWFIILLTAINKFHISSLLDNELVSVVALFLIIGQIQIKNRLINLEVTALSFPGKISYGMYVFHPLLIFLFSKFLNRIDTQAPYKYLIVYFTILSATVLLSYISYNYFEKYFLNLKKKFTVVSSSATEQFNKAVIPSH
jgi:peptidoglycan/LPS O-acetylase OafA/YrhL